MKKPTLWVQRLPDHKDYVFDFCYTAVLGAKEMGHKVKSFSDSSQISNCPTNVVVGSVEMCRKWLETNWYTSPKPIDLEPFTPFLKRSSQVMWYGDVRENLKRHKGPMFVKPAGQIKAFTGFVASDLLTFDVFRENYEGDMLVQGVLDIVSEYRVFVNNDRILACKHYAGDSLRWRQPTLPPTTHSEPGASDRGEVY